MGNTSLPKILVADDSPSDRELLWELFRGYSCVWQDATNGAEALWKVLVEEPDVLMLTSMGARVKAPTRLLCGADGHLDKPFDIDVMRSMVASLVERNGRQLGLQSDP